MVFIRECHASGRVISPATMLERRHIWDEYVNMFRCKFGKTDWGFINGEVYGDFVNLTLLSDTDSVSSSSGSYEFPICWTQEPVSIGGYEPSKLDMFEKLVVETFDAFMVFPIHEILGYEDDPLSLRSFLDKMAEFDLKEMMSLLAKAKAPRGLWGRDGPILADPPSRHPPLKKKKVEHWKANEGSSRLSEDDKLEIFLGGSSAGVAVRGPPPWSFNFWDSSFDNFHFMYDFLGFDGNIEKVKVVGA
ncbi:unnamed protein product [Vicia faba]|uniref:Uncharacterized protein n=1 Tax=Vicia faba TaxID=3906 RepID=A0AAV1AJ57_VICFA|nr:unnamed protein product [Vicia faba]